MRLVIQRVKEASVTIEGKVVSCIGQGLFILVGVESGDTEADMEWFTDFGALPPKISIANPASISEHNHPKRV